MKDVYIKYNPYTLSTIIKVDNRTPEDNSRLLHQEERLQEWIDSLPEILVDEYADKEFNIKFHGTDLDFSDLRDVFEIAKEKGIEAYFDHIPAKDVADKEKLLDEIFAQIQSKDCPFKELQDEDICNAFAQAKASEFEICVVATMSAGKSTLINALLGKKLMPSKQEACTAIITRIKDVDNEDQENSPFKAKAYNKNDEIIAEYANITLEDMNTLNGKESVSRVDLIGDIPFVSSEETSLVFIDTPGPNNARDKNHRVKQRKLLDSSSKALVLYIMTGEFGSEDDVKVLTHVSESMCSGGRQARDRFLFVVNKLDARNIDEDGPIENSLQNIKNYLADKGINNPNLYPIAALPALKIRRFLQKEKIDEDEINYLIRKFNNKDFYLEEHASLPLSNKNKIKMTVEKEKKAWKEQDRENPYTALIHTGITAVEEAIRLYVEKYAKTARIKNIVDTFKGKIDSTGSLEATKNSIMKNNEQKEKIKKQIGMLKEKLRDTQDAKEFKEKIDYNVSDIVEKSKKTINDIVAKHNRFIANKIEKTDGELDLSEVNDEVARLRRWAENLIQDFISDVEELIQNKLIATSKSLVIQYREKLQKLAVNIGEFEDISIDPIKLMAGSIQLDSLSMGVIHKLEKEKQIADGEEWVKNTDKKWYKPWTWFQESGYWRTKYKTVKYIPADELAQEFFAPIEAGLHENRIAAGDYAKRQAEKIAFQFKIVFDKLDEEFNNKLEELDACTTHVTNLQEQIDKSNSYLKWIGNIQNKVQEILEI